MDDIDLDPINVKKKKDLGESLVSPLGGQIQSDNMFKKVGRGLADFMRSVGHGATNTPINMAQPGAGWQSNLGGMIGGNLLESALYGKATGRIQPQFYNTEPEQAGQQMVLQKAVQMKMLENQIEQDKLRKFLETNPEAKIKSARIGDITYEKPERFGTAIEDLDISKLSEEEKVKTFQSLIKKYPDINVSKLKSYFWPKLGTVKTEDLKIFD